MYWPLRHVPGAIEGTGDGVAVGDGVGVGNGVGVGDAVGVGEGVGAVTLNDVEAVTPATVMLTLSVPAGREGTVTLAEKYP